MFKNHSNSHLRDRFHFPCCLVPRAFTIAILGVLLCANCPVFAGVITGFTWSSGIASVALNPIAPAGSPNNDDVAGPSPNVVMVLQKDYVGIGPVDIQFDVVPSGGVTEYRFSEGVQNSTGVPWTDYHIQLGFGMGTAFTPSPSGDGLDFDAPAYNSPFLFLPFPTVTVMEDDIDAVGGIVPDFTFVSPFIFHVDVPDGITAFTVRQFPTVVPEPTGWWLLTGLCGIAFRRRRVDRAAAAQC